MSTSAKGLATLLAQLIEAFAQERSSPQPAPTEPRSLPARVLLTVEEAAHQLGIGRTKAYDLISTGELESVQIGRLRRVPISAITEYAARLVDQQIRDDS